MSILRGAISALKLTGFKAEADSVSQLFSTANQLREELDTLRARIGCLDSSLDVQTQLLADANAQLNAMRAERDSYKAKGE